MNLDNPLQIAGTSAAVPTTGKAVTARSFVTLRPLRTSSERTNTSKKQKKKLDAAAEVSPVGGPNIPKERNQPK